MMNNDIEKMREKINELNTALRSKYGRLFTLDTSTLRRQLEESIGRIISLEPMTEEELKQLGAVVGVDGSTNRMGGAYPHYVELFQGLAKNTQAEDIYIQKIYTPLLDEIRDEKDVTGLNRKYLATVELEAALESIDKDHPNMIIMDGSLIRYNIENFDRWRELREACISEEILIVGLIKDISTKMIGEAWGYENYYYDKEILAGKLNYGDLLVVNKEINSKQNDGFSSAFMRPSLSTQVVGIDVIDVQDEHLEKMAQALFTLTPRNSRGVPLWIDIVDKEVKISNTYMRGLIEENVDRDLVEQFFVSERDRRN